MNTHTPWTHEMQGTKKRLIGLAFALAFVVLQLTLTAAGPDPVALGEAAHFTILAGAAVTTTGGGTIDGDVGAYPIDGASIGIPPVQVNGTIYARDATGTAATNVVIDANLLLNAQNDMHTAWVDAAGRTPPPVGDHLNPQGGNLGGLTLAPGLYKFTTTAYITGSDVILDGGPDDVWIFMCDQDLQVGSGIKVILVGGARAKNIFWQVGTSAVLGTSSVFKGTILADQAITMQTSSTLEGRALAYIAGVTFNGSGGVLPSHTLSLDLDADNNGGTLGGDYANTFTPGDAAVAMSDPLDATITDSIYTEMASLTIASTGMVDGVDEIVAVGGVSFPQNVNKTATVTLGLTTFQVAFDSLAKVFTITKDGGGKMPLGDLHDLLRDITYENVKAAPTAGDRVFQFTVNDSVKNSIVAVSTITVSLPPVLDLDANDSEGTLGTDYANTFIAGGIAVSMSDPLDATITDSTYTEMASLTIAGTGMVDGADEIVAIGGVSFPQNVNKTATVTLGLTTFQVAFDSLTKVFAITKNGGGTMPLNDLHALLRDITYENVNAEPTAGDRIFQFTVNNSVIGSDVAVSTITVSIPPAIDLDANDSGGTLGADYANTFTPGGVAVSMSDPLDATVTDSDSTSMAWLTITGTGIADGADEIVAIGGVSFPQNVNKTTTVTLGLTTFQVAFDSLTKVFAITKNGGGAMPVNDLNLLLRDMTYQDAKVTPTPGDRTFAYEVNDGQLNSNTATAIMTVLPILTVVNGTGSGAYAEGTIVPVIATIPVGKVFDTWAGDTVALADATSASTIATMPATGITITAIFKDAPPATYTLSVVNGTGSGAYTAGAFVPVIATIPVGKIFDTWTGDTVALADATSASTIATMPAAGITITAVFKDAPPATYTLTVVNGTGSGAYTAGAFVPVIATVPVGKVFDIWAGDIGALADATSASTIATMPAAGITITAVFKDAPPATYTLAVVNGTGSGAYEEGAFVPVVATIPVGKVFDTWTGDIGALADVTFASTIATMPAHAITISAIFKDAPPATYTLTVVNGTGGGAYTAGAFVPVIATVPVGKVFDTWAGDIGALADATSASTIATMPAVAITISAVFKDAPPATYTLAVVNGTGSGAYEEGAFVPVVATIPVGKVFDTWTGDIGALADVTFASTIATMPAHAITISAIFKDAPPATYTLTVVNGTGGGAYIAGALVPVVATIPAGKVFDTWAGDIGALADATSASTTVTMPAHAITISAVFKDAPPATYTLTVVNGTGGGAYSVGTVVPVMATVPGGKFFVKWVGDTGYLADSTVASTTVTSMPARNITIAGVFNIEPPWFPRFNWTPVPYFDWYDLQIWNGVPGTAGIKIVLETYVMRGMMTPEREYLLGASYGLLPGTYYWRYRTWVPETDTFGDTWMPSANGQILTVDYRNPPINTTNAPVAPNGLGCTPNPGPTGNFNLTFTALNAQGYDLEISGNRPQNNQVLHDTYFMPGADYAIPFNELTTRPITLVGPDTCTWRVRGFNPSGDSAWSSGPAITVTAAPAGTMLPAAGIPDYNFMRPTDGGVVTAPNGTAAIAFEWNPVPGATGYVIFVASASGVPILNYVDVGNVTWVDSFNGARIALPPGSYVWCLTAYNAGEPRQYGGWNHSPRSPDQESPIFFDVVETLTAPTFLSASKAGVANTASITWVGGSLADPLKTIDVMLFYTTAGGWLEASKRPVTVTGTQASSAPLGGVVWTGTVPLGLTWGTGPNYLLLTGKTAAGVAGPRSRLFLLP